jgi:hypothetical protein
MNAFIEFYQLQKSEAILASFLAMIPPSCRAVRDGAIVSIPAAELVQGDIVLLVMSFLRARIFDSISKFFLAWWGQDPGRPSALQCQRFESGQQ